MEKNNTDALFKEWEKAIKSWSAAIKKGDYEVADIMQKRANESYKKYKAEIDYKDATINSTAGELGSMFESALPKLFVSNKKAVGDILRTIKEDKNLKSQLQFFEAMKDYDGSLNAREYINESLSLTTKNIDSKTVRESNRKLGKLIVNYNIRPDVVSRIDEDRNAFYKAGSYLLTHKKNINNLSEFAKKIGIVENYINNHKKTVDENKINIKKLTEAFDKKMSMLTEDEKALVNDIISSKGGVVEERQKRFFNSLKEKCLGKINELINEASDDDKEGLKSIKEEINAMEYCKESIIKDTAKLLEVGAVLSDKK